MNERVLGRMLVRSGVAGAAGLAVFAAGCQAPPPPGTGSGRVPVGWSTPAEAGDARVLPDDYVEFSDQAVRALMNDLPDIAAFRDMEERATILYGDIYNRTANISSVEFETVRERIKNNLMQSRTFNEKFRVIIARAQLDELRRREVNRPVEEERFDEANTYLLNGTMYRIGRGDTHYYLMTFELVNFRSGEIVWVNDYESKRYGR